MLIDPMGKTCLLICAVVSIIAACGPSDRSSEAPAASPDTAVALHHYDSTANYTYDIRLPDIIRTNKVLRDTLTALVERQKQDFLSSVEQDSMPQMAGYPWELQMHVNVHDSTEHFISLLGTGYTYTGGAHGIPFHVTLNYDQQMDQLISMPEIFGDSIALQPISNYVRQQLARQLMGKTGSNTEDTRSVEQFIRDNSWLRDGTEPVWSNYSNMLLQRKGLHIIFCAYQVAPYASGTPKVDVPVSVFRSELPSRLRELLINE